MTLVCEAALCLAIALTGITEQLKPPPIEQMPLALTNYWFFDSSGNPVAWNYQANGEPDEYANLYPTDPSHAWQVAACIQDWTKLYVEPEPGYIAPYTTSISFWWNGQERTVACYDNFGAITYRRPFYHSGYGQWVIPVDVLTPEPVYGLVWDWSMDMVVIGELE